MTIKYAKFEVSIHGLDAEAEDVHFITGWLRAATLSVLRGNVKDHFKWRDDLDTDLEVELVETAGE